MVDELGSEGQPGELHENIKDLFASGSTTDTRYCICSHPADAATIPGKWSIENSLHRVLDVAFDEDHSRVRTGHADRNQAIMRHWALNLLKQERSPKVVIKAKRKKAGWYFNRMLKVLSFCNAIALPGSSHTSASHLQNLFCPIPLTNSGQLRLTVSIDKVVPAQ